MSPNTAGGIRLKTAAVYAEPGEMRDVTDELWKTTDGDRRELINKVIILNNPLYCHVANISSKRSCW